MEKKRIGIAISFVGMAGGLIFFQNCSGFKANETSFDASLSSLTQEADLLKPAVDCSLIRESDNVVLRTINSLTPAESFTASVTEGDKVRLDCSRSKATAGGIAPDNFQLITNTASLGSTQLSKSGVFELLFPTADRIPMQLDLIDSAGKKTTKIFDIVIRCATTQAPPLIDETKVSVQPSSQPGFFNLSAVGAVSGGRPPYQYAWDFQGDTGLDMQRQNNVWASWSNQPSVSDIYTLFANTRRIRIQARDACNLITTKEVDRNFALSRLPASSPATPMAFYYLQGDIRPEGPVAPLNPRVATVDLMAEQPASPPDGRKHVQCFYSRDANTNKAGLRIVSNNIYGSESDVQFSHGATLVIENISDIGNMGSVAVGSPRIGTAQYSVAEIADFSDAALYDRKSECTLNLRINRTQAVVPCAADSSKFGTVLQFLGEYSCPSLRTPAGAGVSIDNGKFFCEKGEIDMCPGGGGGGGGGNPPPAQ